jgi:hypothetical protein
VASRYRQLFGINPRRIRQTCTYSRRELELLGLLAPLPTL